MCNPNKLLKILSMYKKILVYIFVKILFPNSENSWLRTKKLSFSKFTFWQRIKKTLTVLFVLNTFKRTYQYKDRGLHISVGIIISG